MNRQGGTIPYTDEDTSERFLPEEPDADEHTTPMLLRRQAGHVA